MDKQRKKAGELEEIVKLRIGAGDFRVTVHSNPDGLARDDALKAIADVMNAVEMHYSESETAYHMGAAIMARLHCSTC